MSVQSLYSSFLALIIFILMSVMPPTVSAGTYKCIDDEGKVTFSNIECPDNTEKTALTGTSNNSGNTDSPGLREGERRALKRVYDKEERRRYERQRNTRHHVGYSQRLRLREIEMRRSELRDMLDRKGLPYKQKKALAAEMRSLDRLESQLRHPQD